VAIFFSCNVSANFVNFILQKKDLSLIFFFKIQWCNDYILAISWIISMFQNYSKWTIGTSAHWLSPHFSVRHAPRSAIQWWFFILFLLHWGKYNLRPILMLTNMFWCFLLLFKEMAENTGETLCLHYPLKVLGLVTCAHIDCGIWNASIYLQSKIIMHGFYFCPSFWPYFFSGVDETF